MLRGTLDRVALAIPPERTVVVTIREQSPLVAAELRRGEEVRVLAQPEGRGTLAAVLYAAHWIHWRQPEASLALFPSDHFVLEERAFMRHVSEVAAFVERDPGRLVLLGARPRRAETDYGWILPGETLGSVGGEPVCSVRRFWEKPGEAQARAAFAGGGLWNTFVLVAKATVVVDAGRRHLRDLSAALAALAPYSGADESSVLHEAYAAAAEVDFSRAVLEPRPECLAVSRLPPLTWSDWGTPERVSASLRRVGASLPSPARPLPPKPWL
jgi:mannose-1-phosphate guanylyltransferase